MQELVITLASPVFIILIILELIVAHRRGEDRFSFSDTINSIGLGILSQVTGVFLKFGIYAWVLSHVALFTFPDTWWGFVIALLLYDFLYYWLHRSGHEVAILWAAHVVHHQSERYNLSTALRQTSTGPLLSWIFYLPMAVLGVPVSTFIAVGLVDLLYQFWVHTELINKLGWFDRVFVSPSNHRVHHATNDVYLDKNYGGILILWDRLFGTFIEENDGHQVVYGTRSPLRSWNPIWANVEVYQKLWSEAALASNWLDRIRIWFKHPGWQPADVSQSHPHAPFVLHRQRYEPALTTAAKCYSFVQFAAILLITTHFLGVAAELPLSQSLLYGIWIAVGLWVVGGLTEQRAGFFWLESVRLIATLLFVALTGQWFGAYSLNMALQALVLVLAVTSLVWLILLAKKSQTTTA